MAEIRVEPKKQTSSSWVWIVIVVVLAAALVYYLMTRNKTEETDTAPAANTTGRIYHPTPLRSLQHLQLTDQVTFTC